MTEEFTLQQGVGESAAQLIAQEWLILTIAVMVDSSGYQFLSRTAFTQSYPDIDHPAGNSANLFEDVLHRR